MIKVRSKEIPKTIFALTIFLTISFCTTISLYTTAASADSNLTAAIDWLKDNQDASGNWFFDTAWGPNIWSPQTSFSTIALYLNEGNSTNVTAALSWLSHLRNFSAWASGESIGDEAGVAIYAFAQASHLSDINITNISADLLSFQNSDGGIRGWCDWNGTDCIWTSDSTDTSWALVGLLSVNAISEENKTSALSFLDSLQNSDGSINLTTNTATSPYEGLAPDTIASTALYLIASKIASVSNEHTTNALNYLKNASVTCFENKDHSYTAALSAWALNDWNEIKYAASSVNYLKTLQNNSNGGFSDSRRYTKPMPLPLDTAIAAIAMQKINANNGIDANNITYATNASLQLQQSILNGSTQRISVNITGDIICTHNNYLAANIILPNNTSTEIILTFNASSGLYENIFSNASDVGLYNVSVTVNPIFDANKTLTVVFTAKKGNGLSCNESSDCFDGYCVWDVCRASSVYCGDGHCDSGEDCSSCSGDCGACQTSNAPSGTSGGDGSGGGGGAATTSTTTTTTTTTLPPTTTTSSTTTIPTTTTSTIATTAVTTPEKPNTDLITGFVSYATSPTAIGIMIVIVPIAALIIVYRQRIFIS